MRAVVADSVVHFPRQAPQFDRVLVRVGTAGRVGRGTPPERATRRMAGLVRTRLHQIPEVLFQDGVGTLIKKAAHMFRREQTDFYHDFAAFAGHVIDDRTSRSLSPGTTVVGFSLTQPGLAEELITRPDWLWPLDSSATPDIAVLALWGGLISSALEQSRADGAVRIVGSGLLAEIATGLAKLRGISVDEFAPTAIVVSVQANRSIDDVARAFGIDLPESALRAMFPRAAEVIACDLKAMLRSDDVLVDLYYPDGSLITPPWFKTEAVSDFLRDLPALSAHVRLPQAISRVDVGEGVFVERIDSRVRLFRFHDAPARQIRGGVSPDKDGAGEPAVGQRSTSLHAVPHQRRAPYDADGVRLKASKTVGLSLIGSGRWPLGMVVRRIARDPGIDLRGVCDRRPEAAYLGKQALSFAWNSSDPTDALEDPETDAVVVAPYHGIHAPFATDVLLAGKHCFVEKPPVINQHQLEELAAAAGRTDKILYVGYNRRFAPLTDRITKQLATREGPLLLNFVMRAIDIPKHHWYYWPSNGNRIISNVCHLIDYALLLARPARPQTVTATPFGTGRDDENVVVTVGFDDGSLANLTYTTQGKVRHGYFQRYLIAKGDLFIEIDGFRKMIARAEGRIVDRWSGLLDMGHRSQMRAFAHALVTGGPSPVSLGETLVSAQTVLAAAESAQRKEPVVVDVGRFAGVAALPKRPNLPAA